MSTEAGWKGDEVRPQGHFLENGPGKAVPLMKPGYCFKPPAICTHFTVVLFSTPMLCAKKPGASSSRETGAVTKPHKPHQL